MVDLLKKKKWSRPPLPTVRAICHRICSVRGARLCASLLATNFGRGTQRRKSKRWMQVESTHIHRFRVEHPLFTFKNDDLVGFSQGFLVVVIHVVMDSVPASVQREFRFELRLCGHLA